MGFINLGKLNIRKRNSCASALVSLSDIQPPSVYKSHILNRPINKLYILDIYISPGAQGKKKEVHSSLIVDFGNPVAQNKHSCYYRFWPGDISRKAHETHNSPFAHLSNFYRW